MKKTLLFTFGVLCGIALISSITVVFAQNDGGIIQRLLKLERDTQPPIGTIVAWHKSNQGTPALPSGWVECNGKPIADEESPYNGQNAPNLNNERRFLRGGNKSGKVQKHAIESHSHNLSVQGFGFEREKCEACYRAFRVPDGATGLAAITYGNNLGTSLNRKNISGNRENS